MKRTLAVFLAAEALACFLINAYGQALENTYTSLLAFPFDQIGAGLRALSVSGPAGNIFALILYGIVCLLPAVYLIFRALKKRAHAEDGLLALLSVVLFVVVYLMVNPAYITRRFGTAEVVEASKAFLGVTVDSIAAGYIVLRALRVFQNSGTGSMLKYLRFLLYAVCILLTYGIFGSGLAELFASFRQLAAGNTMSGPMSADPLSSLGLVPMGNIAAGQSLTPSYLFLVLQYIVGVLPLALEIAVTASGLALIGLLERDPYDDAVAVAARKTGRICRYSVIAIMLSQISVNVLQLALGSLVRSSHYSLSVPLMSIVFVLAAMLLARYFEQAKQIKDENDRFI